MDYNKAGLISKGSGEILSTIERRTLKILVVIVIASGFFVSLPLTLSLVLGGGISAINFKGLRYIVERAFRGKRILLLALFLKFFILLGLLFVIISYAKVHKAAFIVGLSTPFMSVAWEGFKGYFGGVKEISIR